ncbi:MAG: hypothetical protein ACUVWJ_10725 [Spirochaetota bacterium]
MQKSKDIAGQVLMVFFFIITSMAGISVIGFALYRVAILSKRLYGLLFLAVAAGFLGWTCYRLIRQKLALKVLMRVLRVIVLGCTIILIIMAFALCGAVILRYPFFGSALTAGLMFLVFYIMPKFHVLARIKSYFSL